MRNYNQILPFFFLFLFIFSIPGYAAPVNLTYNTSLSLGAGQTGLRCTNSTLDNQIYCYSIYENAGSPYWSHSIYRYNSTMGFNSSCSLNSIYSGFNLVTQGFAVLNESYLLLNPGSAYCDLFYIQNITSGGNCQLVQRMSSTQCKQYSSGGFIDSVMYGGAVYGNSIYAPRAGAMMINNTLMTNIMTPYWASSYDWGYGATWANEISIPNKNDNSTIIVSSIGTSTTNYTHSPYYQYVGTSDGYTLTEVDSPETLYNISWITSNYIFSDFITDGTGVIRHYMLDSKHSRGYMAYWNESVNYSTSCEADNANYPIGTICDGDSTNRIYTTNDGCNLVSDSCPSGSVCSQLTPQINVSTSLIENYTSCQIVTNAGFRLTCFNICFLGSVVGSNCMEESCKVCPQNGNSGITWGTSGVNVNTWYSNQSSVSVPSYTIACIDTTTGAAVRVINSTGGNSSEIEIITAAGNNVTALPSDIETPYTPSDAQGSFIGILALGVGSMFGVTDLATSQWIFSMLFAMAVGMMVLFAAKDKEISYFVVPFLSLLCLFTLVGWFPGWVMILLIVVTAFIIAKKLGIGG